MNKIELTNWEKYRLCELDENGERKCSKCGKYWVQIAGFEQMKSSMRKSGINLENIVGKNQYYFPACYCAAAKEDEAKGIIETSNKYDETMKACGIPKEFLRFGIDNIPEIVLLEDGDDTHFVYTLQDYAKEIETNIKKRRDLYFFGEADKRKTTTGMILAHEAAKKGLSVFCCTALDIFNISICDQEWKYRFRDKIKACQLLIVDELAETEYEGKQRTLKTLWDYRYSNYLGSIFITNMSLSTVLQRYEYVDGKDRNKPFETRLKRFWKRVEFTGKSYRGLENERN